MGNHKDFEGVELSAVKVVTLEDAGSLLEKRDGGLEAVDEGAGKVLGVDVNPGEEEDEEEEEPIQWNKVRGLVTLAGAQQGVSRDVFASRPPSPLCLSPLLPPSARSWAIARMT